MNEEMSYMKKVQMILLVILMSTTLFGCEDVKYYESEQIEIISFNTSLYVNGFREGYHAEDLVIYDEVTYFNKRTGANETNSLLGVWYNAFKNAGLSSVTIITSENSEFDWISNYAFSDNENLKSVIMSPSIDTIGLYSFAKNPKLESIDLNNLEEIGGYAFLDCIELKEIHLGSKIFSIGDYAFKNNHDDLTIYITNPIPPTIGKNIFSGVSNFKIIVPQEFMNIYKEAGGWSAFADHIYPNE
jgi:hypothetical protein